MDEKVLRLFADVGPHAKEALDSYVTLQWVEFFALYAVIIAIIGFICFISYVVVKSELDDEEK